MSVDKWLEEPFDTDIGSYHFAPEEMLFQVVEDDDMPFNFYVILTPKGFFEAEQCIFGEEFKVDNFEWPPLMEAAFEPDEPMDPSQAVDLLNDLGMTECAELHG